MRESSGQIRQTANKMPRAVKPVEQALPDRCLVIDNGGYAIKAGFVNPVPNLEDCQIIPNCLAKDRGKRVYVGAQLDICNDFGEMTFRRPIEKGFLVNWEAEKAIWDNTFIYKDAKLSVSTERHRLEKVVDRVKSVILVRRIYYSQKLRIRLLRYRRIVMRSYSKSTNSLPTAAT